MVSELAKPLHYYISLHQRPSQTDQMTTTHYIIYERKNQRLRHPGRLPTLHEPRLPESHCCLRRIAEQQISDKVRLWRVISPKYQKNQTGDCPYFRPSGKQTYALGFIGMLEQMPYRQMQEAASRLLNHFGRRTYYRVRKGERPLSPNDAKKHFEYTGTVWHR